MTAMPQLVAAFHSLVVWRGLCRGGALYAPDAFHIAEKGGGIRMQSLIEMSLASRSARAFSARSCLGEAAGRNVGRAYPAAARHALICDRGRCRADRRARDERRRRAVGVLAWPVWRC